MFLRFFVLSVFVTMHASMDELKKILDLALKAGASDIHLVSGCIPMMRVHRELVALKKQILTPQTIQKITSAFLTQNQLKELTLSGDIDLGMTLSGTGLRINIHKQSHGLGLAIRLIPSNIPSPNDLLFHETMRGIPDLKEGFVIVSGPTGSGKSTTLASLIQMINTQSSRHIITLEDPIEYRFTPHHSLIEQRQLGIDFPSFQKGLRHVLRQDPDVIVVGEMRDPETISLALTAAETGHLVLSTLHAPNAPEAIERIVNVFDGAEQRQILVQLSATLRVIVAQRLLPKKDGGMVAAWEVLTSTTAVRSAIQNNNLGVLKSAVSTGKKDGMITMERSMQELKKAGIL